jgi:hypothetical protein
MREGPFAADEIAVPAQDSVWLEQEQQLVQLGFCVATEAHKFVGKESKSKLLPARNAEWLRMMSLQDTQLLAQQQDFEVLVVLGASGDGEEVEQQRDDLREKKVEHSLMACMSCAEQPGTAGCRSRTAHSASLRIFRTLHISDAVPGRKKWHRCLNSACASGDEKEHVQGPEPGCFNCEEVASKKLLPILVQEAAPTAALPGPLGSGRHLLSLHYSSVYL